jgi:hypothetical protein
VSFRERLPYEAGELPSCRSRQPRMHRVRLPGVNADCHLPRITADSRDAWCELGPAFRGRAFFGESTYLTEDLARPRINLGGKSFFS